LRVFAVARDGIERRSATSARPRTAAEELQRCSPTWLLVVGPQLVELAPRVRHAAHLGHAQLEAGLVAAEVVAHELAAPAGLSGPGSPRKLAHMLAAAAVGEVEDHRLHRVVVVQ
jgi:hypothetical protein